MWREKSAEKEAPGSSSEEEEAALQITPLMVVIFVMFICLFLLMVYYLYSYVVYVIIGVFALASASGMYECLNALALKLPFCKYKQVKGRFSLYYEECLIYILDQVLSFS